MAGTVLSEPALQNGDRMGRDGGSVFSGALWFDAWLDAFGGNAAGVWMSENGAVRIPYRLGWLRVGPWKLRVAYSASNAHSPRFDILGSLPDANGTFKAMMRELGVSALVFYPLAGDSPLLFAGEFGQFESPLNGVSVCERAPYIDCTGSWDDYVASRGSKTRQEWRRQQRRSAEQGFVLEMRSTPAGIGAVLDDVLDVEASGWKGEQGSAIVRQPDTLRFYRRLARDFAERGYLRLYLWWLEDTLVAFQFCIQDGRELVSLKIGFRPDYARSSPGQMLQLAILQELFADDGIDRFNLLGPETRHKTVWATGVETLWTVRYFAPSPGGLLGWVRHVVAPRAKAGLESLRGRSVS